VSNRATQATGGAGGPVTGFGPWRAVAVVPAMLGSVPLVAVAIGPLDRWRMPILSV
jgi:hypothetical protein